MSGVTPTAPRGSSSAPTYRRQPPVDPASTATLGTPAGSTLARQSASCASNTLVQGIDTTRMRLPASVRRRAESTASPTSEPVAISTQSGRPPQSTST